MLPSLPNAALDAVKEKLLVSFASVCIYFTSRLHPDKLMRMPVHSACVSVCACDERRLHLRLSTI